MKFVFSLCAMIIASLAVGDALPAQKRMVYYQQQGQWFATPQRMMFLQYVQPGRTHARSTQAASALVAGDAVATGTLVNDCEHTEAEIAAAASTLDDAEAPVEDVIGAAGANGASSVAEAYPEPEQVPLEEGSSDADATPVALAPIAPTKTTPNKKIFVELDEEPQGADESGVAVPQGASSDDDENTSVVKYPNRQPVTPSRPNKGPAATKQPLPAGSYFPVNFGGTNGGAIAIANSFSTGEGGTATSHAVAYGSPDAARARTQQPLRRH